MIIWGEHSYGSPVEYYDPVVHIGKYCPIGAKTSFYGRSDYPSVNNPKLVANYAFSDLFKVKDYPGFGTKGDINIGNDVWVGQESIFLSGVTVGDGARIGIRTIVSKDIPPYAVVVGSPMVIKKYRFPPETIEKLLKIKWWDWSNEDVINRIMDFLDVDKFVEKYYTG